MPVLLFMLVGCWIYKPGEPWSVIKKGTDIHTNRVYYELQSLEKYKRYSKSESNRNRQAVYEDDYVEGRFQFYTIFKAEKRLSAHISFAIYFKNIKDEKYLLKSIDENVVVITDSGEDKTQISDMKFVEKNYCMTGKIVISDDVFVHIQNSNKVSFRFGAATTSDKGDITYAFEGENQESLKKYFNTSEVIINF